MERLLFFNTFLIFYGLIFDLVLKTLQDEKKQTNYWAKKIYN